jgi:hypothetical protein
MGTGLPAIPFVCNNSSMNARRALAEGSAPIISPLCASCFKDRNAMQFLDFKDHYGMAD